MTTSRSARFAAVLACALMLAPAVGCGDIKKRWHLYRGDRYFAAGRFKEAIIEYRNVLQLDPRSKEVSRNLGLAAYKVQQLATAYTFLERASREGFSSDLDVRLKLGTLEFLGRQPDRAREHARFVLGKDPDNFAGVGLLADSAQTVEEIDEAIAILEERPQRFGERASVDRALGLLYARKKDTARAEKLLLASIEAKPDTPEAHSTLARLHVAKGEIDAAEKEFRAAATASPPGSRYQLELADYLFSTGKAPAARAVLEEITQKAPDAYAAWTRLADLAFQEGRLEDCSKAIDLVVKQQPTNTTALLLRARVALARGETKKGLDIAKAIVAYAPGLPMGHYVLALAHLQSGNTGLARNSANDALRRSAMFADALFLGADLAIRANDPQDAIRLLSAYSEKLPQDPRPHLQMGMAHLRAGAPERAAESLRTYARMVPSDPRGPFLQGLAARAAAQPADARRFFEQSLSLSPSYADPLIQLTDMSTRDKRPEAAIARAKQQAALAPKSGEVAFVLATAYQAGGQDELAEKELLQAIELNPGILAAYARLAGRYSRAKDYPRAQGIISRGLAKAPDNPAMLMLSAEMTRLQGDVAAARALYEKILAKQPDFAPAANNLAFILANEGGDLKRAFALAQTARKAAPEDPQVADTLGWVLFKQERYTGARDLFTEALAQRPNDPSMLVHLGRTQQKLGDNVGATATFKKALELDPKALGS